jgi:hypothetical protein
VSRAVHATDVDFPSFTRGTRHTRAPPCGRRAVLAIEAIRTRATRCAFCISLCKCVKSGLAISTFPIRVIVGVLTDRTIDACLSNVFGPPWTHKTRRSFCV